MVVRKGNESRHHEIRRDGIVRDSNDAVERKRRAHINWSIGIPESRARVDRVPRDYWLWCGKLSIVNPTRKQIWLLTVLTEIIAKR